MEKKFTKKQRRVRFWSIMVLCIMMICMLCGCDEISAAETNQLNLEALKSVKVERQTEEFYVNDFVGLFTDSQKEEMLLAAENLNEDWHGVQVVVSVVESLKGSTREDYGLSMYNQYKIGTDDMGLLILLSLGEGPGDRDIYVLQGAAMNGYLPDSFAGTELVDNYGMEFFVNDELAEGLMAMQKAAIEYIREEVPSDWNGSSNAAVAESSEDIISESNSFVSDSSKELEIEVSNQAESPKDDGLWLLVVLVVMAIAGVLGINNLKTYKELQNEKVKSEENKNVVNSLKQESSTLDQKFKREQNLVLQLKNEKSRILSENGQETYKLRQEYQSKINELEAKIRRLESEAKKNDEALILVKEQYTKSLDTLNRIQKLHPDINFTKEVDAMREKEWKEAAANADKTLEAYFSIEVCRESRNSFDKAFALYDSLDRNVKKYVKTDMKELQRRKAKALELQRNFELEEERKANKAAAKRAYNEMHRIYDGLSGVSYKNYEALHCAYQAYSSLTSAQKGFFEDSTFLRNFEREYNKSADDYKAYSKAKDAEKQAESEISGIYSIKSSDLGRIRNALHYYDVLNSDERKYFSDELISRLKRMERDAKRKQEEEEEEERRKKRRREAEEAERRCRSSSYSSYSSHSSSFSSGSSHRNTGGGGHSIGGGAGRKF